MALGLAAFSTGQHDVRDRVVLKTGKEFRGRIAAPYDAQALVIMRGGLRQRAERSKVAEIELVGDKIRLFLERRLQMRNQPRAQWFLVEWAQSQQLPNFARLQAMLMVLESGDERAREFLGHRQRRGEWQWPHDGGWYSQTNLEKRIINSPLKLEGERFRLTCNSNLTSNIKALFDLERTAVWWYDNYGEALGLLEALEPVEIAVMRDATRFQRWGFRPMPYYALSAYGGQARTFYTGANLKRPKLLFYTGAQGLLYRSLIGDFIPQDDSTRICPWLEVGLPMLAQQVFAGEPGYATPGPLKPEDRKALEALERDYRLTHLLHLPMYGGFYLMNDAPTNVNWSAATMFVQYLLDDNNQPATRQAFFAYAHSALAERKGDSSSLFDRAMGRPVEEFEKPFRAWLRKVANL